jgi:RND family efflux transporter MFP subunit
MKKTIYYMLFIIFITVFSFSPSFAQKGKDQGMPPAMVVVSPVKNGVITPKSEFIGTVYYEEVSDVAAEVSGSVDFVNVEEGQRVKKGDVLVTLSSDLLEKTVQATRASHEQILSELENARLHLERIQELHKEELIPEKTFDDARFSVKGLEKRAASLEAEVERLEIEMSKKDVRAPFDGVVLKDHVDRGEWLAPGSPVITVAKDDVVDIIVDVPEEVMQNVKPGRKVLISAGGKSLTGKVFQTIPAGDVATRVFPVKIRLQNNGSLIEGMEARVSLPIGKSKKALIVPRDALMTKFGMTVVFVVVESKAKMIPVTVIEYEGQSVGIASPALQAGMDVVIKGNERIMDDQPVMMNDKGRQPK